MKQATDSSTTTNDYEATDNAYNVLNDAYANLNVSATYAKVDDNEVEPSETETYADINENADQAVQEEVTYYSNVHLITGKYVININIYLINKQHRCTIIHNNSYV